MSEVLENFIVKLKKDVQKSLLTKEKLKAAKYNGSANGNSRLYGTIKTKISGSNYVALVANDYWIYVDGGRKKGSVSKAGQGKISDWISRKGLNPAKIIFDMRVSYAKKNGLSIPKKRPSFTQAKKQFSFIVSRKIKNKGYEGNDFVSEVVNDGRLDQLNKDIGKEIKLEIVSIFNK